MKLTCKQNGSEQENKSVKLLSVFYLKNKRDKVINQKFFVGIYKHIMRKSNIDQTYKNFINFSNFIIITITVHLFEDSRNLWLKTAIYYIGRVRNLKKTFRFTTNKDV